VLRDQAEHHKHHNHLATFARSNPCDLSPVEIYPCEEEFIENNYISIGVDPVIVAQMKDHCVACVLEDELETSLIGAQDSGESRFMLENMQKSAANLFVKQAGQAAAFDAFAVSQCRQQVTSFSFKALSTQRTIMVGLTANQDDSTDLLMVPCSK